MFGFIVAIHKMKMYKVNMCVFVPIVYCISNAIEIEIE